jgi:hypothetical protein
MVKIEGRYFCSHCKLSTYHVTLNETRMKLLEELLDYFEPSKFTTPGVLTCTECMNPNNSLDTNKI